MASWKKVIVSGSTPELANLQIDGLASGEVVIGAGSGSNLTTTAVNGTGNIVATTAATGLSHSGSFSGSFEGDGSALSGIVATDLDIDNFGDDLTGATLTTTDKMILSDGGTEGRINVGQLATPLAGTGLEADSNTVRIAAAAAGNGLTGGAGSALAVGAGTGITVNANDVQISDGGVTETQLNTSVAGDGLAGGGGTALSVNVDDSSIETNADTLRVKASGITNAMLNGSIANDKLSNSSVTVGTTEIALGASSTTLAGLTDVVGTKFSGSFSGSFQGDGSDLTGIATTLTIDADSGGTSTVDLTSQTLDVAGTSGEIETSVSGQTITVGLPSNVTIGNNLTVTNDATIAGDLIVGGALVSASSLEVADQFIILASGSNGAIDGGIIVNQVDDDPDGRGVAFAYDSSADRWALQSELVDTATTITPDAFMGVIQEASGAPSSDPVYGGTAGKGTIYVNTANDEIFIYS